LKTEFHLPYDAGKNCHWVPLRLTQMMASTKRRTGRDAEVNAGAGFQKLRDLFPLFICQVSGSHAASISATHQFRNQLIESEKIY
jgi:hypothetical protein